MMSEQKSLMRRGLWVFLALMLVEIIEYVVGTRIKQGNWPLLAVLAVPGSGLIIYYFMHLAQLWRHEE